MPDWVQIVLTTFVAPLMSMVLAYVVTRRKELAVVTKTDAETDGVKVGVEKTYRDMFYDESERRRVLSSECEEAQDALKQAVDENEQLRAQVRILRDQVIGMGYTPLTDRKSDTKPRGMN